MTRVPAHIVRAALIAGGVCLAAGGASFLLAGDARQAALAVVEPGEALPGGAATTKKSINRDIFSQPSANMSFERRADFAVGNAIFRKLWVSAPASTVSSDGLGPLYNARGCQNCHIKDGRGHPPAANWPEDDAVSMIMKLSIPPETQTVLEVTNSAGDPVYGHQLQDLAIQGHDAEGHIRIDYEETTVTLRDGTRVPLRKPAYSVTDLAYGLLHPKVTLSPRVAPQMIGLGLLEAVPEADIRAGADPDDTDGDGISGRANDVWSTRGNESALGRFGWKAGAPTIRQQGAEALVGDLGLSTSLFNKDAGDCTSAQKRCQDALHGAPPHGEGFEVTDQLFDLVVSYAQNLAVPARRGHDRPDVLKGKAIFHELGCAACHRRSFTTGNTGGQNHLSNQTIWPYTDLLLHDMGEGLADGFTEGVANGREWRTAPLWGIGLTETVSGHTFFLHDGRARSLEEAILWHGGEAEKARNGYAALDATDRAALLAFVSSL